MAVSDSDSVLKVYKSKLLNVDHRTYPVNNYDSIEEVKATSIDKLISDKTILAPDIIKIDIQGYELVAFKGMKKLLSESKDLKIVAEFWPHGFMRAGSSALELFDFFDGLGYSILYASSQLQTDYLFALVFAATVLGFGFLFLVMFLEWYFLHNWHESARAPEAD